jgi:DNA repair protein RadD
MLTLRPYQQRALDDLWTWFADHGDGDPLVEASVGAGKSVLIAELCRRAIEQYAETRVLMVVHVRELLQQNLHKLVSIWPQAPVGVYSAGAGSRVLGRAITYATIGSVYKRAHELGRVDMLIVDECHLISPNEATMYRRLIDELRALCPHMRVIGWTGTAFRGDGVWLTQQGLFTHVAARVTMSELLRDGYLSPLVTTETATRIDTAGVQMKAGDYVVSALARASDKAELVRQACAELVRLAAERRRWLVFAVTVQHAEHLADELRTSHGIACEVVSADTPKAERDQSIAAFRDGRLRALVNVAVLTTGFDVPELDCIALLRATRSPVLYVQIAGRGMRTAPGKSDCLWLDFTDTTATLGPVDAIKGRSKPAPRDGSEAKAPVKHCDECGNPNPTAALRCVECGHMFPEPERVKHQTQADTTSAVLSSGPQWYSITRIDYAEHVKPGSPPSLRVDYWSAWRRVASEWVCLEHPVGSYPRRKAVDWWEKRIGAPGMCPHTVLGALERTSELREPGRIAVQMDGQYPRIVSAQFANEREAA